MKSYVEPRVTIVNLEAADIITASSCVASQYNHGQTLTDPHNLLGGGRFIRLTDPSNNNFQNNLDVRTTLDLDDNVMSRFVWYNPYTSEIIGTRDTDDYVNYDETFAPGGPYNLREGYRTGWVCK